MTSDCAATTEASVASPRLRVEQISKAFSGVHALREVSLDIREGEVLALIGENRSEESVV